jgi:hypothetical protein
VKKLFSLYGFLSLFFRILCCFQFAFTAFAEFSIPQTAPRLWGEHPVAQGMVYAVKMESWQTEKSASGSDVVTQWHHARIVENASGEHQARFPANCEHLYAHLDEQTFLANASRIAWPDGNDHVATECIGWLPEPTLRMAQPLLPPAGLSCPRLAALQWKN